MGARLAELEPHLVEVETRIRQLMPGPGFCSTAARYGESGHSWKREMMAYVGDRDPASDALDRRRPDRDEVTDRLLRTDRAYDVAYDRLAGLLPACASARLVGLLPACRHRRRQCGAQ